MTWTSDVLALPGLIAFWQQRETSGTTLDNAETTAARDATISGTGYTLGVAGPIGTDGAASKAITYSAAGSTGANAADNAAWDLGTSDFSLGCWMNLTASWPASSQFMLGRGSPDTGGGFEMFLVGGSANSFTSRIGAVSVIGSGATTISGTGWHFVVVTMDRDGNGQWYVDGATHGSATSIASESATNINSASSLYIARRSAGGYFDGSLAETFICTSLLSPATVAALYDAAIPDTVTITPSPAPFLFYAPTVEGLSGAAGAYARRRLLLRV